MSGQTPQRGQVETLPGVNVPYSTEALSRQRAFSTASRPELHGFESSSFDDLTSRMIELAQPEAFLADLVGPKLPLGDDKLVVSYECDDGSRQRVTLNPSEYSMVPRSFSPGALARTVAADTKRGKHAMGSLEQLDKKTKQNQIDAFAAKYSKIDSRVTQLRDELKLLAVLDEAASTTWRRRGRTDTQRVHIAQILSVTIPNMLTVVASQRSWTSEKLRLAERSLQYRLFFTTPEAERMKEWRGLFSVLDTYDRCKIALLEDRKGRIEGHFGKEVIKQATK